MDADEPMQEITSKAEPILFTKEQLFSSAKYKNRQDLVDALIEIDKMYTTDQVDDLINNFLKGGVR